MNVKDLDDKFVAALKDVKVGGYSDPVDLDQVGLSILQGRRAFTGKQRVRLRRERGTAGDPGRKGTRRSKGLYGHTPAGFLHKDQRYVPPDSRPDPVCR